MAHMLNATVVPALALAASLEEFVLMLERMTDLEYLSCPSDNADTVGAHVTRCVRQVSVVLGGAVDDAFTDRPAEAADIEHSRRRGLSALRAVIGDLDAAARFAVTAPAVLQPRRDPEGRSVLRSATIGRDLAVLLQHACHHKVLAAQVLASAACAS